MCEDHFGSEGAGDEEYDMKLLRIHVCLLDYFYWFFGSILPELFNLSVVVSVNTKIEIKLRVVVIVAVNRQATDGVL
jgi:uncharacterized protein YifN (PemK superfamily)